MSTRTECSVNPSNISYKIPTHTLSSIRSKLKYAMWYESIEDLIHSKKVEEDYKVQTNLILSMLKSIPKTKFRTPAHLHRYNISKKIKNAK